MKVLVKYDLITDNAETNRIDYEPKEELSEIPDGDSVERWVDDNYCQWDNDGFGGINYGHYCPKVYDMDGNLLYSRKDPEWT